MMNQQPDNLFREKLANHRMPVSPTAWTRLERTLDKKNSTPLYLKVAAAIVLLATVTAAIWTSRPEPSMQLTTVQNQANPDSPDAEPSGTETPPPANVQEKKSAPLVAEVTPPSTRARVTTPHELRLTAISKPNTRLVELREPAIMQPVAGPSAIGRIILVYSAQEVNEKYLDKKALAQATSNTEKPSTLQKLLDKAYELKTTSSPMADLRQKKDEIFALNFRGDKQRTQNK